MRGIPAAGLFTALVLLTLGIVVVALTTSPAEARPQYKTAFDNAYKGKLEKVDCKICHPKESKKIRNEYGQAVGKALGKANTKDVAKIKSALKKVEKESSSNGKTWGELIESGTSPGSVE